MVAYADLKAAGAAIRLFPIQQLIAPGAVAARPLLPSVRYHPTDGELAAADVRLPWDFIDPGAVPDVVLGELARERGSRTPGRLVASAKSWLSHAGVDRMAPILPWGAAEGVARVSPVMATASYLAHLAAAWNHHFPRYPLAQQDVVLTVPASFDEGARVLTIGAARLAGLPQLRLLEEPQAACYDWLYRHRAEVATDLSDARLLLVCDVGGGTTDLTLIQIESGEAEPRLTRIGVGEHLMLGGDNMDLTLARTVEARLGGARLNAGELSQLLQQCRNAKERLLAADAPAQVAVTVLGGGARLIGGARSAELSRDEARSLLVDGFMPLVQPTERPQGRRAAVVEFGLPYAADPAISRHLAAFFSQHTDVVQQALGETAADRAAIPDAILLNGGVFHGSVLADRLLELLSDWRGAPLQRLDNPEPDLAVARGAVAYGLARRGQGVRIGGGSARSYFLLIDADRDRKQGVCLLPRGAEEGKPIRLERTFSLRLGAPVQFHLLSSTSDKVYQPGEVVTLVAEVFTPLPPIATVIDSETTGEVPVQLVTQLTEVGTLDVECVAVDEPARRWQLAFQLRGSDTATLARLHPRFSEAAARLERFYGARAPDVEQKEIKGLRAELERLLGKRESWETPLLRELFSVLWAGARRRRRSAEHERLWFSLTGYCLRPGFGYPLDDWRVGQLWALYEQGVQYGQDAQNRSEWWTLWRRVAGGLDRIAQWRLSDDLMAELRPLTGKAAKDKTPGIDDMARLAGVLERLSTPRKIKLGQLLLERLARKGESPQLWWAVGRLGTRVPAYGSAHDVVPAATAAAWVEQVLALDWRAIAPAPFAAALLARLSGDRERDLDEALRAQVSQRLRAAKAPASWLRMVEDVVELDEADAGRVFGETLPPGLRLVG
ncbi:putative chaperone heat-shock protein [Candidatus Competibacter denitrificans Run_A_D11]|uniref:Chaperone heat-shock protein n=1 Tax=Candidatus Competibacter denitrificans Run_A_D11 TaxID=1400863 RepID=W6MAZ7_9GAMM|nr:putative chaperone heat-shock protein [Candidatus Competibacter denitrificans Run_A_D11]